MKIPNYAHIVILVAVCIFGGLVEFCFARNANLKAELEVVCSSELIEAGTTTVFTANLKNAKGNITYNWTVTGGTIAAGQGTPVIEVQTNKDVAEAVTATVEVMGAAAEKLTASCAVATFQPPKSTLLISTEDKNCDYLQSLVFGSSRELANNPTATLYVVLYGEKPDSIGTIIERSINYQKLDSSRIFIVRGESGNLTKTEFWIVPAGANPPAFSATWANLIKPFELAVPQTPYLFDSEFHSAEGSCYPASSRFSVYAEYLKKNPVVRAKIIIKTASLQYFVEEKQNIQKVLTNDYGIKSGRIQIIHTKLKKSREFNGATEYWFLPPIKKKSK